MKPYPCQTCPSWEECRGLTWKFCMHVGVEDHEDLEKAVIAELDRKIRDRQIQGDHYHAQNLIKFKNEFLLRK